jgi:UDP-sulfoquinovose synthase
VRVLVLGGDGYLGWPTALHLSRAGHEVGVADNFARRGYELEMGVDSLVPIASLHERVERWEEVSGNTLDVFVGDLTEHEFVHDMLGRFRPHAIVHFADLLSIARTHIDRLERSALRPNVSWRSTSSNIGRHKAPHAEDPSQNVSSEL